MNAFGYTTRRLPRVNEKNAQSWVDTTPLTAVQAAQASCHWLNAFLTMA